jgi:hypothetical protein
MVVPGPGHAADPAIAALPPVGAVSDLHLRHDFCQCSAARARTGHRKQAGSALAGALPLSKVQPFAEDIVKRMLGVTVIGLLLGGAVLGAGGDTTLAGSSNVAVHVAFGSREVEIIRTHYAPRYKKLPKGLRKKYARTGQLPPGWQKKMEPMPKVVERELVVLPAGYRRGVIDGHAVIYNSRTHVIVDVAVLF